MTTTGASISQTILYTKVGEQFSVLLNLPVRSSGTWTGVIGKAMVRDSDDVLIYDFGTVTGTVNGDATASLLFTAAKSATKLWTAKTLYVDFSFEIPSSYGPKLTPTYKLVVADGPTNQ